MALEAHRAPLSWAGPQNGNGKPWVRAYRDASLPRSCGSRTVRVTSALPPEQWRITGCYMIYLPLLGIWLVITLGCVAPRLLTESLEHERALRCASGATWIAILRERGVLVDRPSEEDIVLAMHRMLTTPSRCSMPP